jgi:hypothetical protein
LIKQLTGAFWQREMQFFVRSLADLFWHLMVILIALEDHKKRFFAFLDSTVVVTTSC